MRYIDVLRISLRMLQSNGLRSVLTVLGIGVAISLIVVLIGLGYGLQNITIGSIVESKTLLSLDVKTADENNKLSIDTVKTISKINGIRDVSPVIITDGEIRIGEKLAAVKYEAGYPGYLEMQGIKIKPGGSVYSEGLSEIVLSPKVLELLDLSETGIIGAQASLSYTDPDNENASKKVDKVTIVGVTDSDANPTLYIPFSMVSTETVPKIPLIKAVAIDSETLTAASLEIQGKGYLVETLIETLEQAKTVFRWVTGGLAFFGTIALVVAAIGMFNTLTISLLERTREIGIMKSIGVSNKAIKSIFLSEAGMIGFMGGLSGIAMGTSTGLILNLLLNQAASRYGGQQLHLFQYPSWFLISMLMYPVVLSLLTGLYPASRAARLNPLRALRYE